MENKQQQNKTNFLFTHILSNIFDVLPIRLEIDVGNELRFTQCSLSNGRLVDTFVPENGRRLGCYHSMQFILFINCKNTQACNRYCDFRLETNAIFFLFFIIFAPFSTYFTSFLHFVLFSSLSFVKFRFCFGICVPKRVYGPDGINFLWEIVLWLFFFLSVCLCVCTLYIHRPKSHAHFHQFYAWVNVIFSISLFWMNHDIHSTIYYQTYFFVRWNFNIFSYLIAASAVFFCTKCNDLFPWFLYTHYFIIIEYN